MGWLNTPQPRHRHYCYDEVGPTAFSRLSAPGLRTTNAKEFRSCIAKVCFRERDDSLNSRHRPKTLLQFGTLLRKSVRATRPEGAEALLRSELFSREQMKQHGKSLAASHAVARGRAPDKLLARLADNEKILNETCHLLSIAVKANRRIAPAGEWLLDNFYLIEEQIRTAKRHLPKGYSQALPRLLKEPSAGMSRGYYVALETVVDSHPCGDLGGATGVFWADREWAEPSAR